MNDDYFSWLTKLTNVSHTDNPNRQHWQLLHQLHMKPFRWFIHNDENRNEDGRELREEYLSEKNIHEIEDIWIDAPASFLEMLIALSRRCAYNSYGEPWEWFWKLLDNIEIRHFSDAQYNEDRFFAEQDVDAVLEQVITRSYSYEGRGGLFPLRDASRDQTRVELWYQLSAYLLEGEYVANGP